MDDEKCFTYKHKQMYHNQQEDLYFIDITSGNLPHA